MKINSSPESFMIRDKDFSIVSCSPETLIDKKGKIIKIWDNVRVKNHAKEVLETLKNFTKK